ncbi:MAG: c-type cytochrome [Planctomycetes bacterium]|nr:c-type cytochrome [Planctomycetota bacterium]
MAARFLFAMLSVGILALCLVNYWVELTPTWKSYQTEYHALLSEHFDDPAKATQCHNTPPTFRQVYNAELDVADRCTICHLGIETPQMQDAPNPHKRHPGNLLESHPYQTVGCTVCHQGQGLATTVKAAHGHERHWRQPLLTGNFIQATCNKCHHEDEVPEAPVLTRGRQLLHTLGCVGCHKTPEVVEEKNVGPRLDAIGSKVSRKWLQKWLTDPRDFLPRGQMPRYDLSPEAVASLSAYLMTFRSDKIDGLPEPKGDFDEGTAVYREAQCIVCHVTKVDYADNLVGGTVGPDLRRIGNKVNARWLVAFLNNPHSFLPNTKMPRYHFRDSEVLDLTQFAMEEWLDYDLLDAEEEEPALPPATQAQVRQGKLLFAELGCSGCHELRGANTQPVGPDLSFIGGKPVHDLDFGRAKVRRSLPDFLFTKLTSPALLRGDFRPSLGQSVAVAIWANLKPAAMFSASHRLPDGTDTERLAWILRQAQSAGVLDNELVLPVGSLEIQEDWLLRKLNEVAALSPLKMPIFRLSDEDAAALTIAMMSFGENWPNGRETSAPMPNDCSTTRDERPS